MVYKNLNGNYTEIFSSAYDFDGEFTKNDVFLPLEPCVRWKERKSQCYNYTAHLYLQAFPCVREWSVLNSWIIREKIESRQSIEADSNRNLWYFRYFFNYLRKCLFSSSDYDMNWFNGFDWENLVRGRHNSYHILIIFCLSNISLIMQSFLESILTTPDCLFSYVLV